MPYDYRKRARCGDEYGYGCWVQFNTYYKDQPPEVGRQAYAEWLSHQPFCGHKTHAAARAKRLAGLE